MKKFLKAMCLILSLVVVLSVATACDSPNAGLDETEWTATKIVIGNTAAEGALPGVAVPFNIALKAVIAEYNATKASGAKEVEFVNRADSFTADTGLEMTTKLVEDDKVFALVGHFGTPTIGSTINYIRENKVPMVYAATGSEKLFFEEAKGAQRNIFPVQPIFTTEGGVMLARAVAPKGTQDSNPHGVGPGWTGAGLGLKKIGVVYTNDDLGKAAKAQIEKQHNIIKSKTGYSDVVVTYQEIALSSTGTADSAATNTAIDALKAANVEVVIIAANQNPATTVCNSMIGRALDVPVLLSYVNASPSWCATLGAGFFTANRVAYTSAWVDAITDVSTFVTTLSTYAVLGSSGFQMTDATAAATYLPDNSFAMAGYIAGKVFIEGLKRTLEDNDGVLSRAAFVHAMESAPVTIPLTPGSLDFSNGQRLGITNMAFFAYNSAAGTFDLSTYKSFSDLAGLMSKIG